MANDTRRLLPPDVPPDHWAAADVDAGLSKGILRLDDDGTFQGDRKASRFDVTYGLEVIRQRHLPPPPPGLRKWSDPATFEAGVVPTRTTDARILPGPSVLVDSPNAEVRKLICETRLIVPCGSRLDHWGNLVGDGGVLELDGEAPTGKAKVQAHPVESLFIGGGMDYGPQFDTDVGVWFTNGGYPDFHGRPKLEWTRVTGALPAGSSLIEIDEDPLGWEIGDTLVITPTGDPFTDSAHYTRFDERIILEILGRVIVLDTPLQFSHPVVTVAPSTQRGTDGTLIYPGGTYPARVLNLSRSVEIGGTSDTERSHIFLGMSAGKPARLEYFDMRYMGPQDAEGDVLSRYFFHFHMMHDMTRDVVMLGAVGRNGGSHVFVSHLSNGLSYLRTITFNTKGDPYWWNTDRDNRAANPAHDILYDGCVAAWVRPWGTGEDLQLAGFPILDGDRNTMRNCFAVGVEGGKNSGGVSWPEISVGIWTFHDNLIMNCKQAGIFVWQNDIGHHNVGPTVILNCGVGILAGAYVNIYEWLRLVIYNCVEAPLRFVSMSKAGPNADRPLRYIECLFDGAGKVPYAVRCLDHRTGDNQPSPVPAEMNRCEYRGYTVSGIGLVDVINDAPPNIVVNDGLFLGNQAWLAASIMPASVLVLKDATDARRLMKPTTPGQVNPGDNYFNPAFNASIKTL